MFQTFLHMHVYCLNIQLFFLFFFFLCETDESEFWMMLCQIQFCREMIWPISDQYFVRFVTKSCTVHFLEEWKTRFYLRFNKSSKWWMTIRKIDFSQEKYSIWIFFRMTHFWDESSELVLNHFSRRESRSEYWETYQVHREIQFYTDINLLKGETGIT